MKTELTQQERLNALLALLDDVIKKDEERTQGEWTKDFSPTEPERLFIRADADICEVSLHEENGVDMRDPDASFIASASVSHGRNARIVKCEIEFWQSILSSKETEVLHEAANIRIEQFLSLYPDKILKRFEMKNNIKWYYTIKGSHVHCRCFVNGANSGRLVFRKEEWDDLLLDWTTYKGAIPTTLIDETK